MHARTASAPDDSNRSMRRLSAMTGLPTDRTPPPKTRLTTCRKISLPSPFTSRCTSLQISSVAPIANHSSQTRPGSTRSTSAGSSASARSRSDSSNWVNAAMAGSLEPS